MFYSNGCREEYDLSDDGSDSTLTSLSGDSLPDNLDNLTPRATEDTSHDFTVAGSHDTADEEEMIRTELRRTNAHGIGAKPGHFILLLSLEDSFNSWYCYFHLAGDIFVSLWEYGNELDSLRE